MLHVIIYGAIGVAVVAVLVAVFIRTGEKEAAANPRRAEALLVERSGDPALINLYYKARSDEERAEIAGFARAAQPYPEEAEAAAAPAEAEVMDDTGDFADFPEEAAVAEKKPGLLERHRAKREAKAAAAAAAAAEAAKVTVRLADQAGEKYDDLESAMAAAISKLEGPPNPAGQEMPAEDRKSVV